MRFMRGVPAQFESTERIKGQSRYRPNPQTTTTVSMAKLVQAVNIGSFPLRSHLGLGLCLKCFSRPKTKPWVVPALCQPCGRQTTCPGAPGGHEPRDHQRYMEPRGRVHSVYSWSTWWCHGGFRGGGGVCVWQDAVIAVV